MENTLVIARAGTLEHLDDYFEKAKDSDGDVGNWCRLGEIDFRQPQGTACSSSTLPISVSAAAAISALVVRFVGVAPEAARRRAKKGITMIYKIRTELEQGIALLAEAEEALKEGSLDAGKLSRLEQLSSPTDAMVILRRQAAYMERFENVFRGMEDYRARHPVCAKPSVLDITADSILLSGFGFTDADGNVVEHYDKLRINTDVEKDKKGQILFLLRIRARSIWSRKGCII